MIHPSNTPNQQQTPVTSPTEPRSTTPNVIPVTTGKQRSLVLIVFGTLILIASIVLFSICTWIISIESNILANYVTLFCCIYHTTLSIVAIIGGNDVIKNYCFVSVCMGLSIVGFSVIASVTILIHATSWYSFNTYCHFICWYQPPFNWFPVNFTETYQSIFATNYTHDDDDYDDYETWFSADYCDTACRYVIEIHLSVIINISILAILDLILSILNCVTICRCRGTSGQVIHPQFSIPPVASNPPYSFHQPF